MKNRYSRRDNWGDRDRVGDFSESDRGERDSYSDRRVFRPSERYFGQGDMYGRGYSSDESDYRQESWRSGGGYQPDDRYRGRSFGSNYSRGGYANERDRRPDSWVGRSNFESGWGGYGTNRYDRSSYDPYWSDDDGTDRGERGWWDRASDEVASWFGNDEARRRREMDDSRQGDHRGKGPRNYTRSDDRIREDINDRLTDDYALDASDIEVEVSNCEVILTGTVDSRSNKRHAEDIAESVSGVRNVENRLRVKDNEQSNWGSLSRESADDRSGSSGYYNTGGPEQSRTVGGSS